MGANGAGKSTLVKILTGAVRPDSGTIAVRGRPRTVHSPGEARRGGLVSVYQEPALIPDLDIRSNLRLTETPLEPFRHWLDELGLPDLDLSTMARGMPLASLRIIDLARALAIEPDVLMLDEMTAALPANLTERVLEVVGRHRGGDRSVIFISHRMIEIAAVCDRATVLREGVTVGVVDVTAGSEDRIVELMLGSRRQTWRTRGRRAAAAASSGSRRRACRSADSAPGTKLQDVTFDLYPGEVLGVVALEGQGQDELFDVLAGSERPSGGELLVDGTRVSFRHPADAIRAGLVYVAADRAEALLMQRSVRENIALPATARVRRWGPIDLGRERQRVHEATTRLQIDTRASREVRRLSGGNQQKVTIARWVAQGLTCSCASTRRAGSTSARRTRSTCCSAISPTPARPSSSTPRSSRRCRSSATGRSSSSAGGSWTRSPPRTPTSRRCCEPRTTFGRTPRCRRRSRPRRPRRSRSAPRSPAHPARIHGQPETFE